ncbi:MAG TPA: nitroreductase/quinone reductase family protein [Acidimicrobiia bacterium]|jgi:deazaflavin-dependent oxidoreductase (nitroreductase family)
MSEPERSEQYVEQVWETPSHDEIVQLTATHVEAMESMDDVDEVWQQAGMHHVLLRTVGRKSGKEHKVALPTWRDPDGGRVVVASFAGSKAHPSWYLNLSDRDANPEVLVKVQGGKTFWSKPEILDGEEYERIWAMLNADRAWYDSYQAKTDRRIPLVRLPETRPA